MISKNNEIIDFIRTLDSTVYNLAVKNDDIIKFYRMFSLI